MRIQFGQGLAVMAALVCLPAVAQQPPGSSPAQPQSQQSQAQQPQSQPARPQPGKPATPQAAEPAQKCGGYDQAKNAVFTQNIKLILNEMPDRSKIKDAQDFRTTVEGLYGKYEAEARAGNIMALRKMLGIEIFAAQIQQRPSQDVTLRKACVLAKAQEPQRLMADVLTCAVISLEPTRRENEVNVEQARQMMATAGEMASKLPASAPATKILYEDVQKGLSGCY